jgi:hypothetical protein
MCADDGFGFPAASVIGGEHRRSLLAVSAAAAAASLNDNDLALARIAARESRQRQRQSQDSRRASLVSSSPTGDSETCNTDSPVYPHAHAVRLRGAAADRRRPRPVAAGNLQSLPEIRPDIITPSTPECEYIPTGFGEALETTSVAGATSSNPGPAPEVLGGVLEKPWNDFVIDEFEDSSTTASDIPAGWEKRTTAAGVVYFVDHVHHRTTVG